jgi:hypothetical protein
MTHLNEYDLYSDLFGHHGALRGDADRMSPGRRLPRGVAIEDMLLEIPTPTAARRAEQKCASSTEVKFYTVSFSLQLACPKSQVTSLPYLLSLYGSAGSVPAFDTYSLQH